MSGALWTMLADRTRVTDFGGDLHSRVWFDWNAVCGTALAGTPWFWAVFFQGEIIESGNEPGEQKAKNAAVKFATELQASPR